MILTISRLPPRPTSERLRGIQVGSGARYNPGVMLGRLLPASKRSAGEVVQRSFSDHFPELLAVRCERHFIFYLHPEGQKPQIIDVLHERMDLIARLLDRLS